MKFRLRQIEVFRAVMLTGTISAAARMLFVSQPAVSRIVAHTETSLGLKLFARRGGKLVPTDEAERLYAEVDNFFRVALQVDEFARNLAQGAAGTLSIVGSPSLSRAVIVPAIRKFSHFNPKVDLDFFTALLNDIPNEVLSKRVDVAVSIMPVEHPSIVSTPFMQGRMICVLPLGHPLLQNTVIDMAELGAYPLVMHHRKIAFGQMVEARFAELGITPIRKATVLQTEMACLLVEAGVGAAIIDPYTAATGYPQLEKRPLVQDLPLRPSINHTNFDSPSRDVQRFIDILEAQSGTVP